MRLEKDFKEFIELLNKDKVKYLVVGGFAIAYHAIARFTKDIDIFVEASEENSKKIMSVLKQFGFGNIGLNEGSFRKEGQIIQLGYPPLRIDLVTSISGVKFETAWGNREKGTYGDIPCYFISKEDLIKNKRAVGRNQDKADLEILEKSRQ
jgi:hypothetical protein